MPLPGSITCWWTITMTTPANSPGALPGGPSVAEADHTALVTRLLGEAYSQIAGGNQIASPQGALAESVPVLPAVPDAAAPSALPPVHPNSQPAAPKLASPDKTPSGAH